MNWFEEFIVVVIVLGLVASLVSALFFIIAHLEYPGEYARIERLRSDTKKVSGTFGDHVMGQVTKINQRISSKQRYNQIPFLCWFIPNGWDKIDLIEVR